MAVDRVKYGEVVDAAISKLGEFGPLVELDSLSLKGIDKVVVLGDLHGDIDSLQVILNVFQPGKYLYIALGDYVDRGDYQVETLGEVLKLFLSGTLIPLRGNHESYVMNEAYGFLEQAYLKLGSRLTLKITHELFPKLPYALILTTRSGDRILMLHGGLAKGLNTVDDFKRLKMGDEEPSDEVAFQVLWNDPDDEVVGFVNSPRGPGAYLFGPDVTKSFTSRNNVKIIVRGHSYISEGVHLFHNGLIVSLFTSSSGPYIGSKPKALIINVNDGSLKVFDVLSGKLNDIKQASNSKAS